MKIKFKKQTISLVIMVITVIFVNGIVIAITGESGGYWVAQLISMVLG